jgi:proteasome lid subunit RPN8/RPN11
VAQSLTALRMCGRGRNECVVIWLGERSEPECVTRVIHPRHRSGRGGYRIDDTWLNDLWEELADTGEQIVAQVHTHPRSAFHSLKDDAYPILLQAGLYSLVIPNFAQQPIDEREWFLARLRSDGSWSTLDWQSVRR